MHHIYHTEGIILGGKNYGEAGKCYFIFTRDLGLVFASAQGVRKMSSKLRYVLQEGSYLKIDLVRGKDFWRVTSASKTNQLDDLSRNVVAYPVFHNIARLLRRLLPGEDANPTLFADVLGGLSLLEKSETKEDLRNVEIIIVLRILNNLGYIGGGEILENLIKSPFEDSLLLEVSQKRPHILSQINKALKETHL